MAYDFKRFRPIAVLFVALAAGCATAVPERLMPDADGIVRSFLAPATRLPLSESAADAAEIAQIATATTRIELDERRSTERVRLDQLAYFFRSPEGRAYLLAAEPKALVRASPAASCPVQVSAQGVEASSEVEVIADALRFCHDDLARMGEDDCRCEVLAHGPILRAPLVSFEYAIDLPARIFQDGQLDPVRYLAREALEPDGERHLRVEANGTEAVEITWPEGDSSLTVSAQFADGTIATGTRQPVGFDRGRLVQSFSLTRTDGVRVRVILAP